MFICMALTKTSVTKSFTLNTENKKQTKNKNK